MLSVLNPLTWVAKGLGVLAIAILQIASLITYMSGVILNFVVQYTVVDMKEHIEEAGAINKAWKAIRDIANMSFIFVLLYAAIRTIIGADKDVKKLIVRVIVVAILINFSLFFTKVIIDTSNIMAVTFYDAIAPGALNGTAKSLGGKTGIANSLMDPLKITTLWKVDGLEGTQMLVIGIMGTIFSLIAAFVFFSIAIMFVIRFVVLIFTLILSPLAFMAFILPQLDKYRKQWWDALSGQAFFAPIYFLLTWIVIIIARGLLTSIPGSGTIKEAITGSVGADGKTLVPLDGSIRLVMNFIIMIVLLIASLITAKEWANKAGPGVTGLTKWAMGAAGGATLGMAGRFGRGTVGRAGAALGDNEKLKERASKDGIGGIAAQLTLAAGRKTGGASFDVRSTGLGGTLDAGKAGGKGGFTQFRKDKAESEAKFAASLVPSQENVDKAEQAVENTKEGTPERAAAQSKLDQLKGVKAKDRKAELDEEKTRRIKENPAVQEEKELSERIEELEDRLIEAKKTDDMETYRALASELSGLNSHRGEIAREATRAKKEIEKTYEDRKALVKDLPSVAQRRKEAYTNVVEKSIWGKIQGYNRTAATQIRKGESKKDKALKAYREYVGETAETEEPKTPPETPPTPSPSPIPPSPQ